MRRPSLGPCIRRAPIATATAPLDANVRGSLDQASFISNFNTMSLTESLLLIEWYANFDADSHMVNTVGILSSSHHPPSSSPSSIIVSNGALLPITYVGSHSFSTP